MNYLDKTVVLDIDGVVRDLYSAVSKALNLSSFTYEQGTVVFDLFTKDPTYIETANTTEYAEIIPKYFKTPLFVSYQIESWRPGTLRWLRKNFKSFDIVFTNSSKDKKPFYDKFKYIIEDNPHLQDYSNVILVDACYNQKVEPFLRVKTKLELDASLMKISKGKI